GHIFMIDSGTTGMPSKLTAIRAADGVTVNVPDSTRLFHPPRRLRIAGHTVLALDDDPKGGKVLRLHDILTGDDLWRQEFPAGSKAAQTHEADLAAVVEPDASVSIFDLAAR